MKILLVVDMQYDFINGSLGTPEAVAILSKVEQKIKEFNGELIFTRDTHDEDYLQTLEGINLPVPHCIKGTKGWEIPIQLLEARENRIIDKVTFGSKELPSIIEEMRKGNNECNHELEVTVVGLCTDICVISNAIIIKAFFPEANIIVDASCCAGVTPDTHKNALEAMKMCQIKIENQ